jgi:transcriptional regulator NrdR family protein
MDAQDVPEEQPPEEPGIRCRKCGCRDLRIRNTIPRFDGSILRYRVCRHCGTTITTVERAGTNQGKSEVT